MAIIDVQYLKCVRALRPVNGNRIESVGTFILSQDGESEPDIFKKGKKPSIIALSGNLSRDVDSLIEIINALKIHCLTGKVIEQLVFIPSFTIWAEADEIRSILNSAIGMRKKVEESTGLPVHIFPRVGGEILHLSTGKYQKLIEKKK